GLEGLRTFSGTDQYNNKDQLPYADFRMSVRNHFAKKQSKFKARYDFHERKQQPGESIRD
ncbi:MAG: hypothetical protein GY696_22255, partial [Gammaproteobacteria bacterium]|nr:hypothetical protein [Gammaproteobacteria bacterium]